MREHFWQKYCKKEKKPAYRTYCANLVQWPIQNDCLWKSTFAKQLLLIYYKHCSGFFVILVCCRNPFAYVSRVSFFFSICLQYSSIMCLIDVWQFIHFLAPLSVFCFILKISSMYLFKFCYFTPLFLSPPTMSWLSGPVGCMFTSNTEQNSANTVLM